MSRKTTLPFFRFDCRGITVIIQTEGRCGITDVILRKSDRISSRHAGSSKNGPPARSCCSRHFDVRQGVVMFDLRVRGAAHRTGMTQCWCVCSVWIHGKVGKNVSSIFWKENLGKIKSRLEYWTPDPSNFCVGLLILRGQMKVNISQSQLNLFDVITLYQQQP